MARLPAQLRGRGGPDLLMDSIGRASGLLTALAVLNGKGRRPARPVDRSLHVIVTEVSREADGVVAIRLADLARRPLPAWQPGCHLDVRLPSGRLRQYSLCGDPADRSTYRIAVRLIKDGGGGSREIHELAPGSRMTVSRPRNAFPLATGPLTTGPQATGPRATGSLATGRRYLFVAGGIGITPILAMVRDADRRGADWRLVYTGRSRDSLPFLDELARHGDRVQIRTDDVEGMPGAADLLPGPLDGVAVYCCGPAPMIELARSAAAGAACFHSERFSPAPVIDGRAFDVHLARQNVTVHVPAGKTALEAIREAVPDVAYSCRQGFCGTCRVRVLNGTADHRDNVLSDSERESEMMMCVSRATGDRMTLDI